MPAPSVHELLRGLQKTLTACGLNYEQTIIEFGQVAASDARAAGRTFAFQDHIRGLLYSQLSSQRPWMPIARNQDRIDRVFFNYDADALQRADPTHLTMKIRAIQCGNRAIAKQMNALAANIAVLRRIERECGGLDKFVASREPDNIARQLSSPGPYKLQQVGYALALEYLRNLGIRSGKPDLHVCRILGGNRLAYFPGEPSQCSAAGLIATLAKEANCNPTYLDNLLWLFCASDYGNVCSASPRCNICAFANVCRYPSHKN